MDKNNKESQPIVDRESGRKLARDFTLSSFTKTAQRMVATSESIGDGYFGRRYLSSRTDYSLEEIQTILSSGSLEQKQNLSEEFFEKDGFYKRIIMHYASLLKYVGILIPNPKNGKNLSTDHIKKRYQNSVNFLGKIALPIFLADCAQKVLRRGSYYGLILKKTPEIFSVLELPYGYCRSSYKTESGIDIVEFNLRYFDTFYKSEEREIILSSYPKYFRNEYNSLRNGTRKKVWLKIPPQDGIYFNFWSDSPLFLPTIDAIVRYGEAVDTEMERDREEIRKIIIQQIPHLNDGTLLFEPEEAEQIHRGTVGMMKKNESVSVLTTYADVEVATTRGPADTKSNTLDKMVQNIYSSSGTSSQIFSSVGSTTLGFSIQNDLSLMMVLANKFSFFITRIVNDLFGHINVDFKYQVLPITLYNEDEYINRSFKLASSGYSFLIPMLALGFEQGDLENLKDLETELLKLDEKLVPLKSSYTQSGEEGGERGAPKKKLEEKSPKTIQNEESLDRQAEGGSN